MFTWSVRVGCSFQACQACLVQKSLKFPRPSPTLVPDLGKKEDQVLTNQQIEKLSQ